MWKIWLGLILILHIFILSTLKFTAWPEMLLYPYLFSNGFSLYKDFIYPYPPLLTVVLSGIFGLFGFNVLVLKSFTWLLILSVDIALFIILKNVIKRVFLVLVFIINYIFLQSFLDGNMLWFDFSTVLPILISFFFAVKWLQTQKTRYLFLAFLALFTAIFIKQVAVFYFISFVVMYFFIVKRIIIKDLLIAILAGLIYVIPFILYLLLNNSIKDFWLWNFYYPLTEWSKFPDYVDFNLTRRDYKILVLLLAPLVMILPFLNKLIKDKVFLLSVLFLFAAFLAVYPRFSFFHLQPALPFLILLFAFLATKVTGKLGNLYLFFVISCGVMITILLSKEMRGSDVRFYGKSDQYLAQNIKNNVRDKETVFLFGVFGSQYVYSQTLPPKPWSDNFGWYLEIPGVQDSIIDGFIKDPPRMIYRTTPLGGEWFALGAYQPKKMLQYLLDNYDKTETLEGEIEIWTRK